MNETSKTSRLIFSLLLLSAIVIFITNLSVDTQSPIIEFHANNNYNKTFIVAADKDFDPYSFYDEAGNPSGHDIEMIYLLADAMKMNVEIRLMNWNDAIEAIKNSEVDALLGLVYTPQGMQNVQLSIPVSQ